jgi:uncharacterized membrane protein
MTAGVLHSIAGAWKGNASWMGWNLFLAAIPVVIGVVVFRARRHTLLWWLGAGAFIAFLPNAPYVLTDIVHLPGDLHDHPGRIVRLGVVFQYATFAAGGLLLYALALRSVVRHLLRAGWSRWVVAGSEIGLHALSCAGVYLGRVNRLNSWYLVTQPHNVVASASSSVGSREAVGVMLATFVILAPVTTMVRWAIDEISVRTTAVIDRFVAPSL